MTERAEDAARDTTHTLVVSSPDRSGLVASVSRAIADHGGTIVESHNHTDTEERWFFMRNVIAGAPQFDHAGFQRAFAAISQELSLDWTLHDNAVPSRVAILASHASHCLSDLLYRWKSGEYNCDIPCVISNHENLRSMVEWHGIPFHYVPINNETKLEDFQIVDEIIERHRASTVVLARYMQIFPAELCAKYEGELINIHHSFLPSFIGANPYQKAFDRGVKLIGATCHYVTTDLDEGPIIEQDVVRVDHSCRKGDLVRLGRDVERSVLSRGVAYHLERRVIIFGNRTVVFR
ncbi:MAG: formyltetrahydrofolate deformylase [Pseudomonadota bacterium]